MSNTPTESEFDKELGGILSAYASYTHVPKVFKTSAEMDKSEAIAAIKQAVDKHVLRVDLSALPHDDFCLRSGVNHPILSNAPCECDWSEKRLEQQLINLYGGDNK